MGKISAIALTVLLAGCAYPTQYDVQGSGPGQLYFPGAQPNDRVAIDGGDAGPASQFDGKQTLPVPAGPHRVVVTSGNTVVLDKKVYVGAGARLPIEGP